jgi:CRP-like cAMP-binding protein
MAMAATVLPCPAYPSVTLSLDPYVLDTLMPDLVGHDRQPSAFLVYLVLWRQSQARGAASVDIALQDIAEASGLSKRTVQGALARLVHRQLIGVSRSGITSIPTYTVHRPWRR